MPGPGFKKNPQNINRKGRPKKGHTLTDILTKELQRLRKIDPDKKGMLSGKKLIARKMIELAMSGNVIALKEIYNRIDGMPTQKIEAEQDIAYRIGKPRELKPKSRPRKKPAAKKPTKKKPVKRIIAKKATTRSKKK
jgi:hypothetical protein